MSRLKSVSSTETEAAGAKLAESLPPDCKAVALFGEMGAGKTAFTRGFMGALGYDGVSSPTFALVNEYGGAAFHFDWYRLSGAAEILDAGWDDYLERGLCVVEWSERAPELFPPETVRVEIRKISETEREITW